MHVLIHHPDNIPEEFEVPLLLRVQRVPFEEWNHPDREVLSISDDENERPVSPASTMISLDDAAAQSLSNRFEDVLAALILADMEFRNGLPSDSHVDTALKGNVKAALTVDKTRDVVIIHYSDLSC
jgi:hypothetical protein